MNFVEKNASYVAWVIALFSTSGSIFFSEVLKFPPCILCWYQRILMYPLVIILMVGILKKDKNLPSFVLPFTILGILISLYHNLLYYGLIPESIRPCVQGISCTTKFIEIFGFITIPLLSFLSFLAITVLMLFYRNKRNKAK